MVRTVASFALATLSLLTSYAIVAAWPDRPVPTPSKVAAIAPIAELPVVTASAPALASLAE